MTTESGGRSDALTRRFQDSLDRHADRPALESAGVIVSYRELDRQAGRLARALSRAGAKAGHVVPLLMRRSASLVVAQMAVLRLGATYAPIDLASPLARRRQMIDLLRPAIVLRDESSPTEDIGDGIRLLDAHACLQAADADDAAPAWTTPPEGVPACIMFTSGTTGAPKAVMVPRGGIERLVCDTQYADFRPGARWGFISSPAFDAASLEVWGPLLNGGCCVVQEAPWPTLDDLAEFLIGRCISDAWLTSALFSALVDDRPDAFANLSQLLTGGERVSPRHAQTLLAACPSLRLINGYGPTENTTFTLCHTITSVDARNESGIPIGRPIRGTKVRIGTQAATSDVGELLAGGDGVALGYLNDAALSASKFIQIDGQRWYRTGDLVRRRADGVFEFSGRMDRQVKIQGHRIELEEVESQLNRCPGVGDAVVLVRGDSAEARHLVACFTGVGDLLPDVETVASFLDERLAPHAVPRVLMPMARLPANISGKVDRNALSALIDHSLHPGAGALDDGWTSDTERALAAIWRKCLRAEKLHRHASFWAAGGTSLLALQVSSQIRRQHRRDVTPLDVLRLPVLCELARYIERAPPLDDSNRAVAPGDGAITLTQGQHTILQASALDSSGCAYHVHVALHVDPSTEAGRLHAAMETLAQHHPSLRLTIRHDADHMEARVSASLAAGWWTDRSLLQSVPCGLQWPADLLAVLNRPMDLAQGVTRVDCWPLADGSHLAVWTLHHVAVDEASIDRCLEQLDVLLQGDALAPTYGCALGFASVEKGWTDSAAARAWADVLVNAWRGHDPGIPRAPGPGQEVSIDLPPALSADLLAASQRWGVTPFAPMLVAYGLALQDVFGPACRFVSTPFSRRVEPDLLEPVGYLLDMVFVEAGAIQGEALRQTLARVAAAVLRAQHPSFLPLVTLSEAVAQRDPVVAGLLNAFGFTWRISSVRRVPLGGGFARLLSVPQQGARFAIGFHAALVEGFVQVSVEALDALFLDGRVDALSKAFVQRAAELCRIDAMSAVPMNPVPDRALRATRDDHVLAALRGAWARWIGTSSSIESASDFLRAGGNSLTAMRMTAQLRREHGLKIDAGAFLARPTFAHLCELASAPVAQAPDGCVMIGPPAAAQVLVLVPGRGGQVLGLFKLGEHLKASLGPDHAVAIMDLEGMLKRVPHERPLWFLQERMAQLVNEIGPHRIVGFAGFSLGGLLALGLARNFTQTAPPPVWLLDSYAPRVMQRNLWRRIERRLARLLPAPPQRGTLRHDDAAAIDAADAADATSSSMDAVWDRLQRELARQPIDGARLEVHLVQAQQTLDHVGVFWRRGSNGFNPSDYARWRVHRLDAMHLDLPRTLAADTAALFASELRWTRSTVTA